MRLPTILLLMALVLAAGVLSVAQLESRAGISSVPGVIVLDLPGLGLGEMQDLTSRLPGARMEWVAAGAELLAPFGLAEGRRAIEAGEATVLFDAIDSGRPDWRRGWSVVLDEYPETDGAGRAERAVARAAEFLRGRTGTRPFRVGLVLDEQAAPDIDLLLEQLIEATTSLPSFRRTSLVVLGERMSVSPRRLSLRVDLGRWGVHARPALRDLLGIEP
jgi:hypothetical protein